MKRKQLIEIEDLEICPIGIRKFITGHLSLYDKMFGVYKPIYSKINDILHKHKIDNIIDLCSGDGGPSVLLIENLNKNSSREFKLILTDKFPNVERFNQLKHKFKHINFVEKSVDATNVDKNLKGMRTLFTSFHHFPPESAKQIIADSARNKIPIGIFESTGRTWYAHLKMFLGPIMGFLFTPFIRPLNWKIIFWTYVLPIAHLIHIFDGIMSNFRTYSPSELKEMVTDFESDDYKFEIGQLPNVFALAKITYLIGAPTSRYGNGFRPSTTSSAEQREVRK